MLGGWPRPATTELTSSSMRCCLETSVRAAPLDISGELKPTRESRANLFSKIINIQRAVSGGHKIRREILLLK